MNWHFGPPDLESLKMKDKDKTKEQLINGLVAMCQQITDALSKSYSRYYKDHFSYVIISILGMILLLVILDFFREQFYIVFEVEDYLVWHNVSEISSVAVSIAIFFLSWYSYGQTGNRRNLFIGVAFLIIGMVDIMHTLSFPGMPAFVSQNSTGKAINYWLVARLTQAAIFACGGVIPTRPGHHRFIRPILTIGALAFVAVTFYVVTYVPHLIPTMFVPGQGLTPTKVWLEYTVILITLVAIGRYALLYRQTPDRELRILLVGLTFFVFSELSFTLYTNAFDIYNLLGHFFKFGATVAIFQALFVSGVQQPFIERKRAQEELRKYRNQLKKLVEERTIELMRANEQLQREITERKQMEEALQVSHHFLEIVNRRTEMIPLLREFVVEVKNFTGCAAVGLRMLDENGDIPYQTYEGFSRRFYESESPLSIKSDQCMCINVIKGEIDPKLPFYTEGGSFYMNGSTRFLATVSEEEKGRTRNVCNQAGYESVALVPIRLGDRILGLIHVADPGENMVPLHMVVVLERAAMQLGTAIQRVLTEETMRESEDLMRRVIDANPTCIFLKDRSGKFLLTNKQMAELHGTTPEAMVGKTDLDFSQISIASAEEAEKFLADDREVIDRKQPKFIPEETFTLPDGTIRWFQTTKIPLALRDNPNCMLGVAIDITEQKQAEEALRQRNRELALLNQAGQMFNSTLDLDQVLVTVLEEVRHPLEVVGASVWLLDPETGELVCRQATGHNSELVRGWRLSPGEGVASWVARRGESAIVSDTRTDERHFKGVDQQIGLELRSILSVPLKVKQEVIGVVNVVDTEVDRFDPTDLTLVESLAATASIAIENARLYEQARRDAETRSVLLREVNHRVKNNLAAIIGLLYTERRHARMKEQSAYQSILEDLTNRVQGLATVHRLLSASEWKPLLLSELTTRVIHSSLQMLPGDKHISVDVTPSPVRVTSDQAHNLALVINELATNTAKHALRESDTVHVAVRIALDNGTVRFEFRDDGPGHPEEVLRLERHNVGFDLIQNIVCRTLHGQLSLHNDHGAVTIIQFETDLEEDSR